MRALAALAWALASATPALAGPDGNIEVFPNAVAADGFVGPVDFTRCEVTPTPIFGGVMYKIAFSVYARLSGATSAGISGAEFYVDGVETSQLAAGWTKTVVYAPGAAASGDIAEPHVAESGVIRRVNVTWPVDAPEDPDCQQGIMVFIARIELVSAPLDPGRACWWVLVRAGDPPSSSHLPAPSLSACDFPELSPYCVAGGGLIINPTGACNCGWTQQLATSTCTVAVEGTTWSAVKRLYH